MNLHKWFTVSLVALVLLLVLVACAAPEPTQAPTVAPKATEVPKPTAAAPQPTAAPPPTAAPTATEGPKRGGKITMAIWQSPTTLNPYLGTQTVMFEVLVSVVEGLTSVQPDGTRAPALAKEVPSLENGGVSADGKTITYNLKEGVLWSDGTPFTCDDVKFTWQAIMTPGIGITSTTGYSDIDTIECPTPTKVVLKYKNFYAPYLTLFGSIAPKSAGDPKNMKNWEYNRKPIGTGPFKVQEWVADDHVTLVRNDNYREKDKPYLDQIVVDNHPLAHTLTPPVYKDSKTAIGGPPCARYLARAHVVQRNRLSNPTTRVSAMRLWGTPGYYAGCTTG